MRKPVGVALGILGLVTVLAVTAWRLARVPAPPPSTVSVGEALAGESTEGFARALAPRAFVFPRDHGPHPEFRTEWWYYTGNLRDPAGRHFGFQLTFFRIALAATMPARIVTAAANTPRGTPATTRPNESARLCSEKIVARTEGSRLWFSHAAVSGA